MAHKHLNESQDIRLTEIPRCTPKPKPLAWHWLSWGHCWSWSGVSRDWNLLHNPLFVFCWQHALQVHTLVYTCSITWYITDRFRSHIQIHLVSAANMSLIRTQEVAAKILSGLKNAGVEYIWVVTNLADS